MIGVVGGAQWGDEGKGKLTGFFTKEAAIVVRFNGGANSGHTLVFGAETTITHLLPSGAVHPHAQCFLGNDMVIDPLIFDKEVKDMQAKGTLRCKRLGISPLASLVMPYCLELERLREKARGKAAIGTTMRGIGPTYEMKVRRLGIRVGDLLHLEKLSDYVSTIVAEINPEICHWGGQAYNNGRIFEFLEQARAIMQPFILDQPLSQIVCTAAAAGQNILIEGAQGMELDVTHGTYPYVTSSSTIAGAACSGVGIGPRMIDWVIGIIKAYCTRVGNGPFLTKITDQELAKKIREAGGEYGATTGRPRDVGWLCRAQLRHAVRVGGLTGLVVTKGDIFKGIKPKICTHYLLGGREIHDLDELNMWDYPAAVPVYEELEEFTEDISSCRDLASLPKPAQALFQRIGDFAGVPLVIISVGKDNDQNIILQNPWH